MVKKRLNVKLLLTLAVALVVGGGLTHLVHVWMVGRHAEHMIAEADDLEQRGELRKAADYLHRALMLRPGDSPTLLRYAEALERQAVTPQEKEHLRGVYKQVLGREPDRHDVRRKLVALDMAAGETADAQQHLFALLKAFPRDAELSDLLGQCHEAQGELREASEAYRRSLDAAPQRAETALRLASLLRLQRDRPADADSVLDTLVESNPDLPVAHLARALWRTAFGSLDDAARDVESAVALAPHDPDVLAVRAQMDQLLGRTDDARKAWREALALRPREARLYLGLGGLEMGAGRPAEALACFKEGLNKLPDDPDLLHAAADALLESHAPEQEARDMIAPLRSNHPFLAEYLDARLLMGQGRWRDAARLLETTASTPHLDSDLLGRVHVCLGQCYDKLGEQDRRLSALADALEVEQSFVPAQLGLGAALLDAGRLDEALVHLRWVTGRAAMADEVAWVTLARALLERNLTLPPGQRDWAEVRAALDRAAGSPRLRTEVTLLRARMEQALGNRAAASEALETATREHPEEALLWKARAELAAASGDLTAASKLLDEGRRKATDRVAATAAALEFWERQGGPAAMRFLGEVEAELTSSPRDKDWLAVTRRLAESYLRRGDATKVERLCRKVLEHFPDDLATHVLLLESLLASGSDDAVKTALADLRRIEGEDGNWSSSLEVSWLLRQAKRGDKTALDRARQQLAEIEKRRPEWGRLALLRANLAEQQGDGDAAIEAYLKAIQTGERQPGVGLRTIQLLAARDRFAEADRVARRFETGAMRPDFARLAAEVALKASVVERALDLADRAVPEGDADYRHQLWLGTIRAAAGRKTDADQAFRRATELAPDLPDPWLALVAHLARTDRAGLAEAELANVRQKVAAAERSVTLARGYELLAKWKEADDEYRTALASRPTDAAVLQAAAAFFLRLDEQDQARTLLDTLITRATGSSEETLAWARRQLALLSATPGATEEALQAAQELLDGNKRLVGDVPADQRARWLLDAASPARRGAALKRLEDLMSSLTAEEQFRLARLIEGEDWPRGRELFKSALALDPRNPAYLSQFATELLKHDEGDEARPWVERLEQVEPDSVRTRELKSKLSQRSP